MINTSDKQTAILEALDQNASISQREIARRTGLSLGTTNMLLHQLVQSGCLKMVIETERKFQYVLTAKGTLAKFQKAYDNASRTLRDLSLIQKTIQVEILKEYTHGTRMVTIVGSGEIAQLTERAIKGLGLKDLKCERVAKTENAIARTELLLVEEPWMAQDTRCRKWVIAELLGGRLQTNLEAIG